MNTGPLFVSVFGLKNAELARGTLNLLCLHGIESHGLRFLRLAELLPDATVFAPDLRGHGRSPKRGPWTVDQHVRDLAPLMHRLGPRVVVLGHSYGGLLAWELAREAPDQLGALVLVDPAIAVDRRFAKAQQEAATKLRWPDAPSALAALMAGHEASAGWSVALDVGAGLTTGDDGWLRPRVAPEAIQAAWDQMAELPRTTAWRGPTLVVEASRANGDYTSPWLINKLRELLGDRLEHVAIDAPHTIPSDAPEQLAQAVETFLSKLGGNGR